MCIRDRDGKAVVPAGINGVRGSGGETIGLRCQVQDELRKLRLRIRACLVPDPDQDGEQIAAGVPQRIHVCRGQHQAV